MNFDMKRNFKKRNFKKKIKYAKEAKRASLLLYATFYTLVFLLIFHKVAKPEMWIPLLDDELDLEYFTRSPISAEMLIEQAMLSTGAPTSNSFDISALSIDLNDEDTFPQKREPDPTAPRDTCCGDHYMDIIKPLNDTTVFFNIYRGFYSGFRNQVMAFSALIMHARINNWGQVMLHDKLNMKDTFGTNEKFPIDWLFDVEHWNSYYPALPRLVSCNNILHKDIDCSNHKLRVPTKNATSPYVFSTPQNHLFTQYQRYTNNKGPLVVAKNVDIIIKQGALRPNSELQEHIDGMFKALETNGNSAFMTLHARVEPDMIKHVMCKGKKESNLTKILEYLQETFPEPPAPNLFLPMNRDLMESESKMKRKMDSENNRLNVENLSALNRAVSEGLWNGRVKVFEFGSNSLNGTKFGKYPATIGAWINFYLAVESVVFIGTEISTWSFDVMQTRFHRKNSANYKFLPSGIESWTPVNMTTTPNFAC